MEEKEKVTRAALRAMRMGSTRVFSLSGAAAVFSALSTACQTGKLLGCRFECRADYAKCVVVVRRLPLRESENPQEG